MPENQAAETQAHVLETHTDGVLEIVINRPEKKNAFTLAMYERVVELLHEGASRADVRCVFVRGNGGVFTAGNDLGDFMKRPPTGRDTPVFALLLALAGYEKPIVAAVEGPAVGIGTTMLLHCDLVYAAKSAKFKMPFVDLGLVPEGASSLLLPRMVGHAKAAELLLLGRAFDGQTAAQLGIATDVLDDDAVVEHARTQAVALARKAPEALALSKKLMREGMREAVVATLEREGDLFLQRLVSGEAKEAFTAFFEKRAPDFSKV